MTIKDWYEKHKTASIAVIVGVLVLVVTSFFFLMSFSSLESAYYEDYAVSSVEEYSFESAYDDYGEEASFSKTAESDAYQEQEKKIQRTATISLEIEKEGYETAKTTFEKDIPEKYNGYYTTKNEKKKTYGDKEYKVYTITIKVPEASFDSAVEEITTIGEVESVSVSSEDRTKEYYDLAAYLENYEEEKERILELYEKAETIEDIIKLEERLSDLQAKIDNYKRQLEAITLETDYGTIRITLSEKRDIAVEYYEMTGIRELWKNVVRSFDLVLIFFSNIVAWIILGIVIFLGYKGIKKIRNKGNKKGQK